MSQPQPQQFQLDPIKLADALAQQRNAALNTLAQVEAIAAAQQQHIAALEKLRDDLQAEIAELRAKYEPAVAEA